MLLYIAFLLTLFIDSTICKNFILFNKFDNNEHHRVKRDLSVSNEVHLNTFSFYFVKNVSLSMLQKHYKYYSIEEDQEASISLEWHLDRVDQRELPLDKNEFPDISSENIDVYVMDTGVDLSHPEFTYNNPTWGNNFVGDGIKNDCHGHGTHVASTVGGTNVGVAKKVKIIDVKVLGCNGSGTYSGIIQAIAWVVEQYRKTGRLSIINMSLGGGYSSSLTTAIKDAFNSGGLFFIVLVDNESKNVL
jgi:subtilisin family serine protease